jgi:phage-related protein
MRAAHERNQSGDYHYFLIAVARPLQRHVRRLDGIYIILYIPRMAAKDLFWVGSALDDLRKFPEDARKLAGHQLHLVQLGLEPDDWKPMPAIGPGVQEIRVHTELEHRIFYIAKFAEGVYVLHVFEKKTQRTRQADLDSGRESLQAVLAERRRATAQEKKGRRE